MGGSGGGTKSFGRSSSGGDPVTPVGLTGGGDGGTGGGGIPCETLTQEPEFSRRRLKSVI